MGKRSKPIFIEPDLVEEEQQGGSRPGKRRHVSSKFAAIALLSIRASSPSQNAATPQKVVSAVAAVKPALKDRLLQEASSVTDDEFDDHSLVLSLSCIKENTKPSSVSFLKNQLLPPPIGLALHQPVLARTAPAPKALRSMMISSSKVPLGRPLPPAPLLAPAQWVTKLKPINLSLVQESRK
jgi:hypothetical protein